MENTETKLPVEVDFPAVMLDEDLFDDLIENHHTEQGDNEELEEEPTENEDEIEYTYAEEADDDAIATYQQLVDRGFIDKSETFNGTWDNLDQLYSDIPKSVASALVQTAPEKGQELIKYVFNKGQDLTIDDLRSFMEVHLQAESEPTLIETPDVAREFLHNHYVTTMGIEADVAEAMLNKMELKDDNSIMTKSNEIKQKEIDLFKQQREDEANAPILAQAEAKKQAEQFNKEFIKELQETEWAKERISTVYKEYASGSIKNKWSQIVTNPKAFMHIANILTYFDEKTQEFNFDEFVKMAKTPKVKQTKQNLRKDNLKSAYSKGKGKQAARTSQGKRAFEKFDAKEWAAEV